MAKGKAEGDIEEISFVKKLNKNKNTNLWNILGFNPSKCYAIHVIYHKYGKINEAKIKPKADLFLSEGNIPIKTLISKDFYLDENDAELFNLKNIPSSGISVKRKDSKKYQILKMNPSTFNKIFKSYELGAGAAIYCTRKDELVKNGSVIIGWNTNWSKFNKYFSFIDNVVSLNDKSVEHKERLRVAKEIKTYSNKMIHEIIDSKTKISDFVFQGIGNFEEPYTASWFYEKGKLKKAGPIEFNVTTGSGRSHGDFTVVIKPKN